MNSQVEESEKRKMVTIKEMIERKEKEIVSLHHEIHDLRIQLRDLQLKVSNIQEVNSKGYDC